MAGGKETPRQKMIGMMYLFLTALLALNVSKEIINAFVVINKGIVETNTNFDSKIKSQYAIFKQELAAKPQRVQQWYDRAEAIRKDTDVLIKYLDEIKLKIVAQSKFSDHSKFKDPSLVAKDSRTGQDTMLNLLYYDKKDDYDAPTHLLIGDEPASPRKGPDSADEIVQKCQKFRDILKNACKENPELGKRFDEAFAFKEELNPEQKKEPWGVLNFYHSPVVASVAIISKLQTDIKNAESTAIEWLLTMISASTIKIDKIVPIVRVKSSLIGIGDSLVAEIGLGAIDASKSPTIMLNGRPVPIRGGTGYFSAIQTSAGEQDWKGTITFDGPDGPETLPYNIPFKVSASTDAVIDPSKMNVFYIGIDNPVDIAVPGVDKDKLIVTSSNPKVSIVKGGDGKYLAKPGPGATPKETVEIMVSGVTSTGGKKNFGKKIFRLKSIPDPLPSFGGKSTSDATISTLQLKNSLKLTAVLKDFVFEGVEYKVKRFTMSVPAAGGLKEYEASSDALSSEMAGVAGNMRKGQFISFVNIKAVGPDGKERSLPNLFFKITG